MFVLLVVATSQAVQPLGMFVDQESDRVFVFDPTTDTVLASIPLPFIDGQTARDCEITGDGTTGIVSSSRRLWVVDLTTTPPSIASGTNPVILPESVGLDSTISSDQRYAVLCGGVTLDGELQMVSVDLMTRTVADTFDPPGADCASVDTCVDGSLLITAVLPSMNGSDAFLRKLQIDPSGQLSAPGEVVDVAFGQNVICAPTDNTAAIVGSANVTSFDVSLLSPIDSGTTSSNNSSGTFHPTANRLYIRSSTELRAIGVDQSTGTIDDTPLFTTVLEFQPPVFGVDQIAVDPSGSKIYVPQPAAVNVYDADTGAFLSAITHPDLQEPFGVCIHPTNAGIFADGFESGDTTAWSSIVP